MEIMIEITLEMFLELHEKAVKYDLLKKDYDKATYHSNSEEMIFGVAETPVAKCEVDTNNEAT